MQSLIQFSLLTVFLTYWITTIQASSEMLPDAMKLGVKDCGYCHASSTAGEALNERGTWLKNELSERSETTIDVQWLLEREQDEMEDTNTTILSPDLVEEASKEGRDEEINHVVRKFDYTSRFGEGPAYAGDLKATKYSPLSEIKRKQRLEVTNSLHVGF